MIQPKFEVGDVIKAKCEGLWHIDYIHDGRYLVKDQLSGVTGNIPFEDQESWDLADSKDYD